MLKLPNPILLLNPHGEGTSRILRPYEYEAIKAEAHARHHSQLDTLLMTGMRYEELRRLQKHKEWYDKETGFIHLPSSAMLKKRSKQKDRYVRLSELGKSQMIQFLEVAPVLPAKSGINYNLNLWTTKASSKNGMTTEGISSKMFRKTWESWLVIKYSTIQRDIILQSQGHDNITSLKHYLSLPFTDEDRKGMDKYTNGWFNCTQS